MFKDVIAEVLPDNLKILPFLFLTYLLLEFIEDRAEEKTVRVVEKTGKFGPLAGSLLGAIPQCGFSAAMSNLYTGGLITKGTLLAVFLSTSDEMLPILLSSGAKGSLIAGVILYKVIAGTVAGFCVDAILKRRPQPNIHEMCEREGCKCEDGIFKSALMHTVKIFIFLLVTSLGLSLVIEAAGIERLQASVLRTPVAGEMLCALIGLIPNCAASVVLTQLGVQGAVSYSAMIAGLLTGSGVGLLVLFRMHRGNFRENMKTLALLYCFGVAFGLLSGIFFG